MRRSVVVTAFVGFMAALLHIGCDEGQNPVDGTQKIEYEQGVTTTRVVIRVTDFYSNAGLKDVTIVIASGDSVTTDDAGVATFSDIAPGSYLIFLEKDGYEPMSGSFTVALDQNSNEVPIVKQTVNDYKMAKTGVSVTGLVFIQTEDEKMLADGATVELTFAGSSGTYSNPLRSATTDNGVYSFDNLPEGVSFSVRVLDFAYDNESYRHSSPVSVASKRDGDTARAMVVILTAADQQSFYILKDNLDEITATQKVELTFSESVDTTALTIDSIYVTKSSLTTSRVLVTRSWSGSNKNLKIAPWDGSWENNVSYRLYVKRLRSVNGAQLNNAEYQGITFSITSNSELGDVEDFRYRVGNSDTLKPDYSTNSVALLWSPLAGAVSYEIYGKSSIDSLWTQVLTIADTTTSVSTSSRFTNGKTMSYVVLGKNSSYISDFKTAFVLTLKDETKPVVYSSSVFSFSGLNNATGTTVDTVSLTLPSYYSTTVISEPLDTTSSPTFSLIEAGYTTTGYYATTYGDSTYTLPVNACSWKWQTAQSGQIIIAVPSGVNAAYDTLVVDFSGLADLAGNKVDTSEQRGKLKVHLRN